MAKLPNFKTLNEEAEFWESHSLTEYLDELEDVQFEIELSPEDSYLTIQVTPALIKTLRDVAKSRGLSIRDLLKQWVESVKNVSTTS